MSDAKSNIEFGYSDFEDGVEKFWLLCDGSVISFLRKPGDNWVVYLAIEELVGKHGSIDAFQSFVAAIENSEGAKAPLYVQTACELGNRLEEGVEYGEKAEVLLSELSEWLRQEARALGWGEAERVVEKRSWEVGG